MKIEPYENQSGYRVWLSENEQETLIEHYEEEPIRQLAVWMALHGLRVGEIPPIVFDDFREMDVEEEAYVLRVRDGKTGYREVPVDAELYTHAKGIKNIKGLRQDVPLVDVTKETVRNWVKWAGENLANGTQYWEHVRTHDLRRTWATHTYRRLSGDRAREVVMEWGGWTDVQTFTDNYLGAIPDSVAIDLIKEASLT